MNPSILVETPLGRGQAIFLIDYGIHQNTCWVVALEKNGIVKHFDCNDIILATNYTYHVNMLHNTNDLHPKDTKSSLGNNASFSTGASAQ
jgi:hypothetical protein